MKRFCAFLLAMMMLLGLTTALAADMSKYNIVTSAETHKVIIDTDMHYFGDDMYALFMCLQADAAGYLDLLGITTATPNVPLELGTNAVLNYLVKTGREDVPVYVGSDIPINGMWYADDEMREKYGLRINNCMNATLGRYDQVNIQATDAKFEGLWGDAPLEPQDDMTAAEFMVEMVKQYPGKVTIFSIGSCTNTAMAIQMDPDFARNSAGIYYMGGRVPENVFDIGYGETNWYYDAAAVSVCLEADFPFQLNVPYEINQYQMLTKDVMDRIAENNNTPFTQLLVDNIYPEFLADPGKQQSFWDANVPAIYMMPDIIRLSDVRGLNICYDMGYFYAATKQYSIPENSRYPIPEGLKINPVTIVWDVDAGIFWDFLVDLYSTDFSAGG